MRLTLVAQLIGFIAVAINILPFQVNDRRKMLNIGAIAVAIYIRSEILALLQEKGPLGQKARNVILLTDCL